MRKKTPLSLAFLAGLALAGCSVFGKDDAAPLEGERISVLELEKSLEADIITTEQMGLVAPEMWQNQFWPQAGGYPNHAMQNLALVGESPLEQIWSADIGQGSTSDLPLTAQPILVDGEIFTLDTEGQLSAFNIETGEPVWRTDIRKPGEEDDPVISGGIAFSEGRIYATNGYDEILALHPASGEILWRKRIAAPSRAAPTILNGRLFISTLDNRLLTLDARDGESLWEFTGVSENAGLIGAASPAANSDIVVPAFSSGEIFALRVENGSVAWSDNLSSFRRLGGLSGISDIRAMPVIDRGLVIAISFSGRLVAIDERTGTRIWQREIGGTHTPWVAGSHIFVLSSEQELVALSRETGGVIWVAELDNDIDDPVFYTGPLMAGGRLILGDSEGRITEVSPDTGDIITVWDTDDSIVITPIIAGGTLYILHENGRLAAYR